MKAYYFVFSALLLNLALGEPTKVAVGIYFESCCPDSQDFIVESFTPAYNTPGFTDIASIEMVPYGFEQYNESNGGTYMYTCQHGPNECLGQRIESCVIDLEQYNAAAYIPFIMNLEIKLNAIGCYDEATCCDPTPYAQTVANDLDMDWDAISACVDSTQGDDAVLYQAQLTQQLSPSLSVMVVYPVYIIYMHIYI
ncbi:hypothetical protein RFI_00221 [Reticulomyxa filosa]|uniref:Gamma-interferon-inducible lysosomal thiol reductase n=1 Tax=Reticulomyxa filosa TaxID=46433 RepID=X6PEA9_RETFI|nr:hypothetical protein RFI_00221 [Reticulomyxa filosa]|eukprot:ETO36840.1 hypothetical protein RFI_00221 [Reticulomyxa filosa]